MNSFDILLSFVEGLALIASPCILPVLPLVLSTSIDGGKARPFGIIAGFVVAFSAFVLLSRQIVEALHIAPDTIRYASLVLLLLMGIVLLSDKLSAGFSRLTQGAADFGGKFGAGGEGGFGSGIVIGALIGLVWTPCAGPILAAVLVQVIRQQTDAQSIFVTLAFAIGAGIPMFVIALTGRKLIQKFGFFAQHTEAVRKIFAVLILASVVYLGWGPDLQAAVQPAQTAQTQMVVPAVADAKAALGLEKGLDHPYPAPDFVGIQQWLNSNPLAMADLKGKVVLVDFWTYSCINCVRTLPYVTAWDRMYRDKGLVVIGVHAPEFEFEKNIDNIKAALVQRGIAYPVAVDNKLATWLNYNNQYWPAHYLIDRNGQVVYTHFGEGDYDVTENNIRYLLGLQDAPKVEVPQGNVSSVAGQTEETYLGYERGKHFDGAVQLKPNETTIYKMPATLPEHHWGLSGAWKITGDMVVSESADAALRFNFTAAKVFLVMGTSNGQPVQVALSLNGKPLDGNAGADAKDSGLSVKGHTLYELVSQSASQNGVLEIKPSTPGLEAYAFTFGG